MRTLRYILRTVCFVPGERNPSANTDTFYGPLSVRINSVWPHYYFSFFETLQYFLSNIPYRFLWRSPTAWSRGDEVLGFSSRQLLTEGLFYLKLEHLLKRRTPKISHFLPLLYCGNRFAAVSFFHCFLSTWSFFVLFASKPSNWTRCLLSIV